MDAISTKIHFRNLDIASDNIFVRDNDGNLIQQINYNATDLWTDYVPGRIVKIQFATGSTVEGWGFRVNAVANGEK